MHRQTEGWMDRQTYRQRDGLTDRGMDRQTDRWMVIQTNRQRGGWTDRQRGG
jgi:hypothetical protein